MQRLPMLCVLGIPATAAILMATLHFSPTHAAPPQTVSLMETITAWQYPGSTLLGGASMGDGGNPLVQSIKCRAILTTPDPIEKVIAFYSGKVGTPQATDRREADVTDADPKSVSTQDDSEGRRVKLRVIVVNRAESATTLVISRADGEKETHIAWLHYLRLDARR
jgi:hypothetical protein